MLPFLKTRSRLIPVVGVWIAASAVMFGALMRYSATPGVPGTPPDKWPAQSQIQTRQGLPTLVMMLHPRCPCARASLTELARVMQKMPNKMNVTVLFVKPAEVDFNWEQTDIWNTANSMPGVNVAIDQPVTVFRGNYLRHVHRSPRRRVASFGSQTKVQTAASKTVSCALQRLPILGDETPLH